MLLVLCLSDFCLDTVLTFIHVLRVSSVCCVMLRLTIASILCTYIPKERVLGDQALAVVVAVLVATTVVVAGAGMSPGRMIPLAMACDNVAFGTM